MGVLDSLNKLFNQLSTGSMKDKREAICPNCNSELSKVPGAKTKCKQCGNFMYIRTTPQNERVVVSKEDAENIDREWAKAKGTEFTPIVETESYAETKERIRKQFRTEPSTSDIKWSRYNQKLEKQMKQNDLHGISRTYYEMADFIQDEDKDPSQYRELGYKYRLQSLQSQVDQLTEWAREDYISKVEILSSQDSCELCKSLNKKQYTIEDVKNSKPIPVRDCKHKYGCRCTYIPVVE